MGDTIQISRAIVTVPPIAEPVTLAEAKKQLELPQSDSSHDDHLARLIQSAREQWEHDTDSCCLTQTLKLNLPQFSEEIVLPKRPIQSITSIKYYNTINTQQTVSTAIYSLDQACRTIRLNYLQLWPMGLSRWDAVEVLYVAGYPSAGLVPAIHKQAILFLVGKYFENRDLLMNDAAYTDKAYESLVKKFMRSSYP